MLGALDEGDVYHLQLNQSKPILSQSVSQVQVPVLPLRSETDISSIFQYFLQSQHYDKNSSSLCHYSVMWVFLMSLVILLL